MSPGSPVNRLLALWPRAITVAGVVVMLWAGVAAGRFTPPRLFPDNGCDVIGGCHGLTAQAAMRDLWRIEVVGFAIVLLGLALTWRSVGPGRRAGSLQPGRSVEAPDAVVRSALARSSITGVAAGGLGVFLAPMSVFAAFLSDQAGVAALCGWWVVQAGMFTKLHVGLGGSGSERAIQVGSLVGSALAIVAGGVIFWVVVGGPSTWGLVQVPIGIGLVAGVSAYVVDRIVKPTGDERPADRRSVQQER